MVVDILNKWSIKCHLYLTILLIELKFYIFFTLFCGCYIIYYYLCIQNLTIQNKKIHRY